MKTYILVAGAWLGGWAWREVADDLRSRGHRVYTPSLTGLADRRHLGGPGIGVDTHIADLVNLIETEELTDAILVGHSYAGAVPVPGAAHRIGNRLSHVVYVDSAPLGDGQRMTDLMSPDDAAALASGVQADGDGWRYEFPADELGTPEATAGLTPAIRERMARKASPQPWATWVEPLTLPGKPAGDPRPVLVACREFQGLLAAGNPWLESIIDPSWLRFDLDTGHWPMLSLPGPLAETLDQVPGTT